MRFDEECKCWLNFTKKEKFGTYESCLIAVTYFGWTLIYVPEELKTEELCIIAITNSAGAINHVDKERFPEIHQLWELMYEI